jgi:hypothetical protein
MANAVPVICRRQECESLVPLGLAGEQLCLDHFLGEAFIRTDQTLERAHCGDELDPHELEWLLSDALTIVRNLEFGASDPSSDRTDRMLDLMLILANLHEYVAHHSVRLARTA